MEVLQRSNYATGPDDIYDIKLAPGKLYSVTGFNSNAAERYIQLHDKLGQPTTGDKPVLVLKASADSAFYFESLRIPWKFENGIWVATSTTALTLTVGDIDMLVCAIYA